jgi:hypothetical protein
MELHAFAGALPIRLNLVPPYAGGRVDKDPGSGPPHGNAPGPLFSLNEELNFSRAGKCGRVAQPSLTHAIRIARSFAPSLRHDPEKLRQPHAAVAFFSSVTPA